MTASGYGVLGYGWLLRGQSAYAEKARVSAQPRHFQILVANAPAQASWLPVPSPPHRLPSAMHPAARAKAHGRGRDATRASRFELTVAEKHLCCGSAGTYSFLQPDIANQLKARKLGHLQAGAPEMIVTANIGCLTHLQSGSRIPVRHWVELLDEALAAS
jgi:glycolate oxidase iron-sulfur subunit